MNLVKVNIVKSEALQAMVDFRHDILAGSAAAIGTAGAHLEVHLRRHHNLVAIEAEVFDVASRDFLTRPHLVDIGRVKVIDAEIDGLLENVLAVLVIFRPGEYAVFLARLAEAHHAKANPRNIHTRVAEFYILHFSFLLFLSASINFMLLPIKPCLQSVITKAFLSISSTPGASGLWMPCTLSI